MGSPPVQGAMACRCACLLATLSGGRGCRDLSSRDSRTIAEIVTE